MPLCFENFGLDFFIENQEIYTKLNQYVAQEGTAIVGYYGYPYLNKHCGEVQMILRTKPCQSKGRFEVAGLDVHAVGRAAWNVRIAAGNINRKDADPLAKRVAVTREDGSGGLAVVNLVNADVLPSTLEGDPVKMQIIALPKLIQYFENEEEYAENQTEMADGKKLLLGEGTIFPSGMLRNRDPGSPEFESDESLDDINAIRGTVKSICWGTFKLDDKAEDLFVRCTIDTEFGSLEIFHTVEQVDEKWQKNMKIGATVLCYGTLSGDVAVFEYEKGIVRDEENNLAALRTVFLGENPERIRSILANEAIYQVARHDTVYKGPDEIIARLKFVQEERQNGYFAHNATIVSLDDGEESLDYCVGKRCIVLAFGEEHSYESIAFIDTDADGKISRIVTTTNPRYHFSIDKK